MPDATPYTFSFLSLFPEVLAPYLQASLLGKAQAKGLLQCRSLNPRDFSTNPHRKVDDTPYGGGPGMVLQCQPFLDAFASLAPLAERTQVVVLTPTGQPFTHALSLQLAQQADELVFVCGHYEGFDERLMHLLPNVLPLSLGDFVLTGGELPALCVADAVARHLPGVVQQADSVAQDSFYNGLLDYPHYTRPVEVGGLSVPPVLMSGNHQAIAAWRHEQACQRTQELRPDLWEAYQECKPQKPSR
jgi:tRNA (guanine37-N1)-methyltransferase